MTVAIPRVLVVSESRITRRVVEMTFADQPVELVVAITGPAGLAAWDAQPFAVVLADVAMDGTGGLALARHVQATAGRRAAAVLLMAGQHDGVDDAANAAADVRGVIHKPLDSLQLIEAVREALRRARPPRPAPDAGVETVATVPAVTSGALAAPEAECLTLASAAGPEPPAAALDDQELERVAARLVVADVSEPLVREEIARMRSAHGAR